MRGFRMLLGVLLWGTISVQAADEGPTLLREARGWRGVVEIESRLQAATGIQGEEVQKERVEFFAVTDPKRTGDAEHVLPLRLGRAQGRWSLKIDLRESRGAGDVATKGVAAGSLDFLLEGTVDAKSGEVRLRFGTRGQRLSVKTTTSGMDSAGFGTFRSVATRRSILDGVTEKAALDSAGRVAKGEREFDVKRGKYTRKARIRWSLERLEPEVRGRIVDQYGQPVEGLRVIARTLKPAGPGYMASTVALEAKSGRDGRFRIPAKFATWGLEVQGRLAKGVVTRGWVKANAAQVRFDDVPDLEIEAITYIHARLPQPHLLGRRFGDDVNRYMEYIERRYSVRRLAPARVPKKKISATN